VLRRVVRRELLRRVVLERPVFAEARRVLGARREPVELLRRAVRVDFRADDRCGAFELFAPETFRRLRLLLPFFAATFTPERRAFERPMAMACARFFAPCFPRLMWCISSRTNSPACVVFALPERLARRARRMVVLSGMCSSSLHIGNPVANSQGIG
jgi:hypothetical protein